MPPHALGSGKEVAESAFEALLTETAAHYSRPGAPLPTRAALESIGFQVGLQLVERCVACAVLCCAVLCQAPSFGACCVRRQRLTLLFCHSYSRDKPRFNEHLDAVKFICKEFWNEVFSKQIDNLKTNYRVGVMRLLFRSCPGLLTRCAMFQGVYVLTDSRFRWLSRLAGAPPGPELDAVVLRSLHLPCGIVRGALTGLGVPAVVTAEPGAALPACESHSNTSGCPGFLH